MQIEPDLLREILLELEKAPDNYHIVKVKWPEYTHRQISCHVGFLVQAGYANAFEIHEKGKTTWLPRSLTPAGHQFLDAARPDERWEQAKVILASQPASFTLELAQAVLEDLMQNPPSP